MVLMKTVVPTCELAIAGQQIQAENLCVISMGRHVVTLVLGFWLTSGLAGCLSFNEAESRLEEVGSDSNGCQDPSEFGWNVACPFPSFQLGDDENRTYSVESVNGSGRWVAYVSATWCTHCQPTLDALDRAIEPGRMLVMNKDASDDNMTSWKDHMESELNRTLIRPFLHGPEVANMLGVDGVPHVVLVENFTILAVRVGLWDDVEDVDRWFHSNAPETGYSKQLG